MREHYVQDVRRVLDVGDVIAVRKDAKDEDDVVVGDGLLEVGLGELNRAGAPALKRAGASASRAGPAA